MNPEMGKPIEIKIVNRRPERQAVRRPDDAARLGRGRDRRPGCRIRARACELRARPRAAAGAARPVPPARAGGPSAGPARGRALRVRLGQPVQPAARHVPPIDGPGRRRPAPARSPRARPGRPRRRHRRSAPASPRATFPSIPGLNMTDVGPDRQDPFPNRSFADIVTVGRRGPDRPVHGRRRGQQLPGAHRQRHRSTRRTSTSSTSPARSTTSSTAQAFRGGGQEFRLRHPAGHA